MPVSDDNAVAAAVNCFGVWNAKPVPKDHISDIYSTFAESVPMQHTVGSPSEVQQWIRDARDECEAFREHVQAWITRRRTEAAGVPGREAYLATLQRIAGR